MTTSLKDQVLSINDSITKCNNKLRSIDEDIKVLEQFIGAGYVTLGIGNHSVSFGQLFEDYEDFLQPTLLALKKKEKKVWEDNLENCIGCLQELFNTNGMGGVKVAPKEASKEELWYPDLPGWTWHEIPPNTPPALDTDTEVHTLFNWERSDKRWYSNSYQVRFWNWCEPEKSSYKIVAYATKDDK